MGKDEAAEGEAGALARAAGLQRAWKEHRAAVLEAVAAARGLRTGFARPADPAAEPLPAYRVPAAPDGPR